VVVSQSFASAAQSLAAVQPTQAPVGVHSCASWGHIMLLVHAMWHW
jgi:hypothetical protein